jgi:hypothetical protein
MQESYFFKYYKWSLKSLENEYARIVKCYKELNKELPSDCTQLKELRIRIRVRKRG